MERKPRLPRRQSQAEMTVALRQIAAQVNEFHAVSPELDRLERVVRAVFEREGGRVLHENTLFWLPARPPHPKQARAAAEALHGIRTMRSLLQKGDHVHAVAHALRLGQLAWAHLAIRGAANQAGTRRGALVSNRRRKIPSSVRAEVLRQYREAVASGNGRGCPYAIAVSTGVGVSSVRRIIKAAKEKTRQR